jgi:polar amino acid transport system substrate-binding protein
MKILLGWFFLISLFGSAYARDLSEIQKAGILRVAVDGATPAFNYYKGNELVGFEVDLAKEIAKRLGVRVEWKVQPFNTLLIALNQDHFDVIATSHAVTPARSQVVDFIDPHYCTGAVIVSAPNGPKTAQDLKGKVVVVPVGTVYFDRLKSMPEIKEVRTVPNETDGLQNLLGGRADAWVTEQFVALEAVKNHTKSGIQVGEMLLQQTNAMVVSKGNYSLQKAINHTLGQLLKDGTYRKLSQQYFDRDIRCKN